MSATLDQGLRELLLDRRSEIHHPHPELAVDYSLHLLAASLRARLEQPPDSTRFGPVDDDVYIEQTSRAVCEYLELPSS